MIRHETTIQGIPCIVLATYHRARKGMMSEGQKLEPDEPATYEIYKVLDRKGYPASWLEKKMTDQDEEGIIQELLDMEEF